MNRHPLTMAFRDHDYRVVEQSNVARKFAEQHQVDPDEAYRDAVYDEIKVVIGYAVMVLVAVAIGIMLAVGHS